RHGKRQTIHAGAVPLRPNDDAERTELAENAQRIAWKRVLAVPLRRTPRKLVARKRPHRLPQQLLFFVEAHRVRASLPTRDAPPMPRTRSPALASTSAPSPVARGKTCARATRRERTVN